MREIVYRTYYNQLLDVLSFLHNKKICHLNIKPENILLDSKFNLKITDYGFI